MRGRTVPVAIALAAVLLLAGCTGEDVDAVTDATPTGAEANLTATVDDCSTGEGVTTCKIETANRLGTDTEARIELRVLRDGAVVHREVTTERIQAGRDYVSMIFGARRGSYEATIRRAD